MKQIYLEKPKLNMKANGGYLNQQSKSKSKSIMLEFQQSAMINKNVKNNKSSNFSAVR